VVVQLVAALQAMLILLPSFNVPSLLTDVPKLDGRRVINGYKLQFGLRRSGRVSHRDAATKRLHEWYLGLRAAVSAAEAGRVWIKSNKALVAEWLGIPVVNM
jgi:hypothetical protein